MKFPSWLKVYGDKNYRGDCPMEGAEQKTFFGYIRRTYPETFGLIALHPRNEGKRTHIQTAIQRADGMTAGAPDIIVPGSVSFLCEIKRRDHTVSALGKEQEVYLEAASNQGAFVCVALGCDAAVEALEEWITECSI